MHSRNATTNTLLGATLLGLGACTGLEPDHVKVGEDYAGKGGAAGSTYTLYDGGEAGESKQEPGSTGGSAPASAGRGGTSSGSGGSLGMSAGTGGQNAAGSGTAGTAGMAAPVVISICGNGRVEPDEACDDGNSVNGDGCAEDCTIEDGYDCISPHCDGPEGHCTQRLPVSFRDFNGHDVNGGHPDFAPSASSHSAIRGLVEDQLDADGKPALSATASESNGFFHGSAAFEEWYREGQGRSVETATELVLHSDHGSAYSNRFGKNGEYWMSSKVSSVDKKPLSLDGTPLFFPLDSGSKLLDEPRSPATIPSFYGWDGDPGEGEVADALHLTTPIETALAPFPSRDHNYNFTTEVHRSFRYHANDDMKIGVTGDDDIWVFINGHLAIDMGGPHAPLQGVVTWHEQLLTVASSTNPDEAPVFDPVDASSFDLVEGKVFDLAIFTAKRQLGSSTLYLYFAGTGLDASLCLPQPE